MQSRDDIVFDAIITIISIIMLVIFLYPLYYLVICSLSDLDAVFRGEVKLWIVGFNTESYKEMLERPEIWRGYAISIGITIVGTALNLILTIIGGYVLSCREFAPRNLIMKFITFTMIFNGGLIPQFLLIQKMGMYGTYWPLILLGAINVQNLIIARTFFANNIPNELKEAAFLEGCNHVKMLRTVVLPLSKAIIAVLALYYAVGHWNAYFNAMIYLVDENKAPLQLVLRRILNASAASQNLGQDIEILLRQVRLAEQLKYSSVIVASIPALIAYPFVQKHFVKGIMIGSVKG